MSKVLVTGSRSFTDKDLFEETFNNYEGHVEEFIHGGAIGADTIAEEFAKKYDIPSTIIRPVRTDITSYYLHRNAEMISMCDEVFAFWDGQSRGTLFTINYAKARNKKVTIIRTDK